MVLPRPNINPAWVVAQRDKMWRTATPAPRALHATPCPGNDVYPPYTSLPLSQVHQVIDTVHVTLTGPSYALRTFPDLLAQHFPIRHHSCPPDRPGTHVDELRHPALPCYVQVIYRPWVLQQYPRSSISLDLQQFDANSLLWMDGFLIGNGYPYSVSRADLAIDFLCSPSAPSGAVDEIMAFIKSHLLLKRATETGRCKTTNYLNDARRHSCGIRIYCRPSDPSTYGHDASPRVRVEFVAHRPKIRRMGLVTLEDLAHFRFARLLDFFNFVDVGWASFEGAMFRKLGATTPEQQAIVRQHIAAECSPDATLQDLVIFFRRFIPGSYPRLDSRFMKLSEFHSWLTGVMQRQDRRRIAQLANRGSILPEGGVA